MRNRCWSGRNGEGECEEGEEKRGVGGEGEDEEKDEQSLNL